MSATHRIGSGSNDPLPVKKKCSIARFPDISSLGEAWTALGRHASPTEQPIWVQAAGETLGRRNSLQIVTVFRDQRLVALAPLEQRMIHGISQLATVSVRQIYEPVDCLCLDDDAATELAEALLRLGKPILMPRLPAESKLLVALRKLDRGIQRRIERPQASCPYISLDASWQEPESHFNSGRRSDFRRARKRAEQIGPVGVRILTPTIEQLPQLMAQAIAIEASSWKGEAGTALAYDRVRAAFFNRYTQLACEQGTLRLCFLDLGEQTVAMQIAVQAAGALWLMKIGYDPKFAQVSPGMLLMRETIRYSVEQGLSRYEFLGKSEAWTDVWTKEKHECLSVQIYPFRPSGMLALGLNGAASLANSLRGARR